jgi:hypothetical protein
MNFGNYIFNFPRKFCLTNDIWHSTFDSLFRNRAHHYPPFSHLFLHTQMKTFKTLALLAGGILLAGAANAQISAPAPAPQPATTGPRELTIQATRTPNTPTPNTGRDGRNYFETSYVQQLGVGQYASVIQAGAFGMTSDIQQTASANNSDAYQEQSGVNNGFGANDKAYIYQNGTKGVASQRQAGDGNQATIRQNSGTENLAYQGQFGDDNKAAIVQNSASNFAHQYQSGNNNVASTSQTNGLNWSTTEQRGNSNTALVSQR